MRAAISAAMVVMYVWIFTSMMRIVYRTIKRGRRWRQLTDVRERLEELNQRIRLAEWRGDEQLLEALSVEAEPLNAEAQKLIAEYVRDLPK